MAGESAPARAAGAAPLPLPLYTVDDEYEYNDNAENAGVADGSLRAGGAAVELTTRRRLASEISPASSSRHEGEGDRNRTGSP